MASQDERGCDGGRQVPDARRAVITRARKLGAIRAEGESVLPVGLPEGPNELARGRQRPSRCTLRQVPNEDGFVTDRSQKRAPRAELDVCD